MISPKKLIKIARKWQRRSAMRRNRISFPKINTNRNAKSSNTSTSTTTGNFVIYTRDQKRFTVPQAYLNNNIMKELLKMSEEVYHQLYTSLVAEKSHSVVYSADKKRYLFPLEYLNNDMIKKLINMEEEEPELQSMRPLTTYGICNCFDQTAGY
ncbi:auxin-responsive protein SAUR68-like [Hevea brasiliensis]|uniref:auxin-responsive protein SAUR68-like n=1 Tax=Hevea brasiliensis TaxID=3981 RepID=UPI0025D9EFE9|nr:auxin-responsive protein SAUR68-like [Hevea brasiliensis]